MILNFKSQKSQTGASAKIVDGKLILSFPSALTPIVWQMDLATAKASALEVLEDKAKEAHTLSLKTAKGEGMEVAAFNHRAEAVEGLMLASEALENAQGKIYSGGAAAGTATNHKPAVPPAEKRKKWIGAALGLVILFILFTLWGRILPVPVSADGSLARSGVTGAQQSPSTASGVPVSADAFLEAQ